MFALGCKDFKNLVLPGRWWLQNLILKHIYKKMFFHFFSHFLQNSNMGIKNAEFDADFESVEKAAKNFQWKSNKKMEFFYFYYGVQKFSANHFFLIFCTFFNKLFCVLWYPYRIFLLILALFANFQASVGRNGSKN